MFSAYGTGDPHYLNVPQRYFDFHGQGDFRLIEVGPEHSQLQGFLKLVMSPWLRDDVTAHISFAFGEPEKFAYQVRLHQFCVSSVKNCIYIKMLL